MTVRDAQRPVHTRSRDGRRIASATVVAVLAGLMVAGSATATTAFRDRYSVDYAFSYSCGATEISVVGHAQGLFQVRVGKGRFATAFFAHDNYSYRETHTNPDGDFLVISGDGLFQETRAVPLGNDLFAFSSHDSGRPFTVRDEDGNVLVRDRGTIRETIIFDTEGDDVPGGIFVEEVTFEVAGPHDGLGFDTCDILG
jgi:hypothetical protein